MMGGVDPSNPANATTGAILGLFIALIAIVSIFLLQAALTRASIDDLSGKPVPFRTPFSPACRRSCL